MQFNLKLRYVEKHYFKGMREKTFFFKACKGNLILIWMWGEGNQYLNMVGSFKTPTLQFFNIPTISTLQKNYSLKINQHL